MRVSNIFNLYQGNSLELINMEQSKNSNINFISRTSNNNGVVGKVDKIHGVEPFPAGVLTVALGGSVLSTFVQTKPFYTSFHIMVLEPKKEMNFNEKLFYAMCIYKNAYKYSYGRQANKTLKNIKLPDSIPDWVNTTIIDYSVLDTKNFLTNNFNTNEWEDFRLDDLFDIKSTKTTSVEDLEIYGKGNYPYVTTQSTSNGVSEYYNFFTEEGNVIVIDSAVVGYCSYQGLPFSASDHVEKLIPKFHLNKYIGLFITTIINKENYKYSYGRKFNQQKIKRTVIKLPAKNNKPDWKFIENYIKSLPYADKI